MMDLWKYVVQAGTIGYVLVGISVIALGVCIERYLFWFRQSAGLTKSFNASLADAFRNNDRNFIISSAEKIRGIEGEALKIVGVNFNASGDTALDIAVTHVTDSTNRFLWILELCGGIAPMFGILGTVSGIIVSFQGMSGDMPDTGVMVAGISVSMLTTAIGLIVAIIALVPANHLSNTAYTRQLRIASRLQEYWGCRNAPMRETDKGEEKRLSTPPATEADNITDSKPAGK